MTIPDDSAFPVPAGTEIVTYGGLSKREYFAALAMNGLLGNSLLMEGMAKAANEDPILALRGISNLAVSQADRLIETLNK